MNQPSPAMTVEVFYVPDKRPGRQWEAIVPGCMGCGGSPMAALMDLSNKVERELRPEA